MDLVSRVAHLVAGEQLLLQIRRPRGRGEGDVQVFVTLKPIRDAAGLDVSRPLDEQRYTYPAFPSRSLFAAERRVAPIGPEDEFIAVVGGVDHDGVVIRAQIFQLLKNRSHMLVVLK